MTENRALFEFCDVPPSLPDTAIVLRDVGHDKGFMSVTNAVEEVTASVLRIARQLNEPPDARIFYYDSDGRLDEICHDGRKFLGFKPGPRT